MNTPYINTSFLKGFSALVLSKSGNPSLLYESVGLDKNVFIEESLKPERANSLLIPFDKFVYLLEAASSELDFPDMAMQLARQQDMTILAPVGPVLNRCNNLLEALDVIVKYIKILVSGYHVDIKIEPEIVSVTFTMELPHIQEMVQYQDYAMASAANILNGLLGKNYPLRGCYFLRSERNQNRIDEYSRYYGCPVAFNCRSLSLTCDSSILKQDINNFISQFNSRINQALTNSGEDIIEQVSKVISFSLANGSSSIEEVSASMNYSKRTLQRKLNEKNTSYSALLDSVRFNMANQYLQNTYYRLTDIAVLLGYSNLSAFSRSYLRWSGLNPTEVRKRIKTN